jgi:hypothetical protein
MPHVRSTAYPKSVESNPDAKREFDAWNAKMTAKRAAPKTKGARHPRGVGPALYSADIRVSNWSKTGAEWTQASATGVTTEFEDSGFGLHVAGMRVHAYQENITIMDGSVPMQYYFDNISNYDNNSTSISFKYAAEWSFYVNDGGYDISKLVCSILEQDSNNTATKMRLDFYKDFTNYSDAYSAQELAVQVIIENLDKEGYIETNVRFNLSDAQITIADDYGGTDNTYAELDLNRLDYRSTIALYDGSQVYNWSNYNSYYDNVYDHDLSTNLWLRGYELTRRVPYTVLQASAFFFPAAATVTNNVLGATNVATTDVIDTNNKQNAWILALYIIVGILAIAVFGTTISMTWATRTKRA